MGEIRIIAGRFKGRRLLSPPRRGATRPITGLVKKSLFGMLGEDLCGATVVDLYCGTGTLGLEALSRGAQRCYFADLDRDAAAILRRNIDNLRLADSCTVWVGDVAGRLPAWLTEVDGAVDVAFVDPPYAQARRWSWQAAAETIFAPLAERLARRGLVVLRLPGKVSPPEELGGLKLLRLRTYGDMGLAILGRADQAQDT